MLTITKDGKTIYMDLWLSINELGSGLFNSDNYRYSLTTSADKCTDLNSYRFIYNIRLYNLK